MTLLPDTAMTTKVDPEAKLRAKKAIEAEITRRPIKPGLKSHGLVDDLKDDVINHPSHYTYSNIEPIDVMEAWKLPGHLFCALKYIARYGHKGDGLVDMRKCQWWINRFVALLEAQQAAEWEARHHEQRGEGGDEEGEGTIASMY